MPDEGAQAIKYCLLNCKSFETQCVQSLGQPISCLRSHRNKQERLYILLPCAKVQSQPSAAGGRTREHFDPDPQHSSSGSPRAGAAVDDRRGEISLGFAANLRAPSKLSP
jgi:hypothetical protein